MASNKKNVFMHALLTESTIAAASKKANISRTTAYKYLNDEEFKEELDRLKKECVSDTLRYLQGNLNLCSEELMKIVKNKEASDQVRINAINTVFKQCTNLIETCEYDERIKRIEESLKSN